MQLSAGLRRLAPFSAACLLLMLAFAWHRPAGASGQTPSPAPLPAPPSAKMVAEWAGFPKQVTLTAEQKEKPDVGTGKPLWVVDYKSPKQTFTSYEISIYEKGTMLGKADIEEEYKKKTGHDFPKSVAELTHVETRADGRKVFFMLVGLGTGGQISMAFTTMPGFDLMVTRITGRDDYPHSGEDTKDFVEPTKGLPDVMLKMEEYLQKTADTKGTAGNTGTN